MDLFRKKGVTDTKAPAIHLVPTLSAVDLTVMGIGAIIGAGIFVLTGIVAATLTGPAIMLSYIIAGLACAFSALSYAELASSISGCGSAYGYAYVGFGEIIAWIVGWDLILEYAISVSTVSVGWSGYCNDFLLALNIKIPQYLGPTSIAGFHFNILSFSIILILTLVLVAGLKTSARVNMLMVCIKLLVIALFIVIASKHINLHLLTPFMPFGWHGVMAGASLIFFAYIGFDAVSTAAEETKDPQRALPIGIISSLVFCTLIYIVVSTLLTGIRPYKLLDNPSPLSDALLQLGYKLSAGLIGVGAIAGLTTVMLVMFFGLTRVFFAMARDGLLPPFFAYTGIRFKVPVRIIFLCGLIMASLAGLMPIHELAELVNVGTLFAFIIVCVGVIVLRYTAADMPRPFKTPWMPLIPSLGVISCAYLIMHLPWLTLLRFVIWMSIGMVIYWLYGRHHSKLNG